MTLSGTEKNKQPMFEGTDVLLCCDFNDGKGLVYLTGESVGGYKYHLDCSYKHQCSVDKEVVAWAEIKRYALPVSTEDNDYLDRYLVPVKDFLRVSDYNDGYFFYVTAIDERVLRKDVEKEFDRNGYIIVNKNIYDYMEEKRYE